MPRYNLRYARARDGRGNYLWTYGSMRDIQRKFQLKEEGRRHQRELKVEDGAGARAHLPESGGHCARITQFCSRGPGKLSQSRRRRWPSSNSPWNSRRRRRPADRRRRPCPPRARRACFEQNRKKKKKKDHYHYYELHPKNKIRTWASRLRWPPAETSPAGHCRMLATSLRRWLWWWRSTLMARVAELRSPPPLLLRAAAAAAAAAATTPRSFLYRAGVVRPTGSGGEAGGEAVDAALSKRSAEPQAMMWSRSSVQRPMFREPAGDDVEPLDRVAAGVVVKRTSAATG